MAKACWKQYTLYKGDMIIAEGTVNGRKCALLKMCSGSRRRKCIRFIRNIHSMCMAMVEKRISCIYGDQLADGVRRNDDGTDYFTLDYLRITCF